MTSLARHLVNHLGASSASKLVPLASIFVFSAMMSVSDYGTLNVFSSYLWVYGIALSLNLYTALGRLVYEPTLNVDRLIGTTWTALAALFSFGVPALLFCAEPIGVATRLPTVVICILPVVVLGQLAESIFTQLAIYEEQSGLLARVVGGRAVITILLSVAIVLSLDQDRYLGVIIADAITSLALVVFVLQRYASRSAWGIDYGLLKRMAAYSVPLIPYQLSLTTLAQLDRVMIDRIAGRDAAGLYSMAFNLGMLLSVIVTAALNAFNPRFFAAMNGGDHERVARDARALAAIAFAFAAATIAVGPALAGLVVPARYAESLTLVPLVAVGAFALSLFQISSRVIAFAHLTWLTSGIALVAALVKLGLNALLLPKLGWHTAALTTIVAYTVMFILSALGVHRISRGAPGNFYFEAALLVVALIAAFALGPSAPLMACIAALAAMIAPVWGRMMDARRAP